MDPFVEIELGGEEVGLENLPPQREHAERFTEIFTRADRAAKNSPADEKRPAEIFSPRPERVTKTSPAVEKRFMEIFTPRYDRAAISRSEPLTVCGAEQRELFNQMRELARQRSVPRLDFNAVYYSLDQRAALSEIFLRQARFMENFTDGYNKVVPFSSYYPVYQMMSYEQLRTYFTWRAKVRKSLSLAEAEQTDPSEPPAADIPPASPSYAFLYVYELINQIGTGGCAHGLEMLARFWNGFRRHDPVLDKHMLRWLKDYHIYFNIGGDEIDRFDFLAGISSHNITGGGFYNDDNAGLIRETVCQVTDRLAQIFSGGGADFNSLLFPLSPPRLAWKPFAHALFVADRDRPDSVTVLSAEEIYICRRQNWTRRSVKNGNRRLMGYIFKKTEECLRRLARYKRAITAGLNILDHDTLRTLQAYGIYLDKFIEEETAAFYAEKNKIVVTVNRDALVKIREESLEIQEKLIVKDEDAEPAAKTDSDFKTERPDAKFIHEEKSSPPDPWEIFIRSLTQPEREALWLILSGGNLKSLADSHGVMAEVLTDGINQKAFDAVGDTVLEYDGQAEIYEDYIPILAFNLQ